MTTYKSKILKFKLGEVPLHRQIYYPTFIELLQMVFLQYKEACEVLLDYLEIWGEDKIDYVKKEIRNILHANIYTHRRRLFMNSQEVE